MSITSVLFFPIFIVLTIGFSLAAILAALVDPGGNRAHRVGAAWATWSPFFLRGAGSDHLPGTLSPG